VLDGKGLDIEGSVDGQLGKKWVFEYIGRWAELPQSFSRASTSGTGVSVLLLSHRTGPERTCSGSSFREIANFEGIPRTEFSSEPKLEDRGAD